jgi:large subunit ribosomal protein L21
MYAIVDVAGQQFKVEKDQKIYVHRLEGEEGDVVEFDKVLLIEDGDKILIGEPTIDGALVSGKILSHLKGDKVKVFKKKRRKGYKVLKGHRQYLSQILIEKIMDKGGKKKEAVKEKQPAKAKTEAKTDVKATPSTEKTAKKTTDKVTSKPKATKKEAAPAKKTTTKTGAKQKAAAKKPATKSTTATKKPAAKKPAAKKKSE